MLGRWITKKVYGFIGSMSLPEKLWGNNTVAESFFGSLEQERCNGGITKTVIKHSRIFCSISPCFISTRDCIYIWRSLQNPASLLLQCNFGFISKFVSTFQLFFCSMPKTITLTRLFPIARAQ